MHTPNLTWAVTAGSVWLSAVALAADTPPGGPLAGASVEELPQHRRDAIWKAVPETPRNTPRQPRRVLVWITPAHLMDKDPHKGYCLPFGTCAMQALGAKTGAFEPVISNDLVQLLPETLNTFDAILLQNAAGAWITPDDAALARLRAKLGDNTLSAAAAEETLRAGLLAFVRGGRGIVGLHFAIAANPKWDEFHEMFSGTFTGHPWNEEVAVRLEEPDHPLVAAFGGADFRLADEIYQFGKPFSRDSVRVLLAVDPERTNMGVKWITYTDDGFPQAWVRAYGQGRVFYTGFGHRESVYTNRAVMQFFLDGIQFACGDLEAPTAPRASRPSLRLPGPTPPDVRLAKMQAGGVAQPTQDEIGRITAAAPDRAPVRPAKPRRVLVWGHAWTHTPNPYAEEALKALAARSRAFEAVVSDDPRLLLGDRIGQFDALVMNNIHEPEPFLPADFAQRSAEGQQAARQFDAAVRQSILEFVTAGKGIVGIHAAACALQGWKEYQELMGGSFGGYILGDVTVGLDDPGHPVNAAFGQSPLKLRDEIYVFTGMYSRKSLHVLASLDLAGMHFPDRIELPQPGFEAGRPDRDHAVSWVRAWGQGRVFYTVLGHVPETYWNPLYLAHLLAGVQFAIGDLPGDTTPSAK